MAKRVLVTGGAGFIGSHTVDALVERGYDVRVFDNLEPQVHGAVEQPAYLHHGAEFVRGDVRDRDAMQRALHDVQAVIYLAAAVGIGQSMYEIRRYVDVNSVGAATFLDVLAQERDAVEKVVVASSMSIYGEGAYGCPACGAVAPRLRPEAQLQARDWEPRCPGCGKSVLPAPTSEGKPLAPTSVYAVTKRDHEELFLAVGRAYGVPTVALRYFNVYGARQSLSNPYTGVVAIFASRLLNNRAPVIFEDGRQSRDFVNVRDVVAANMLALERPEADFEVFNVGTGVPTSVRDIGEVLAKTLGVDIEAHVEERFRAGDIRHCFADIGRIRRTLGFEPKVRLEDGITGLLDWLRTQAPDDHVAAATAELTTRNLIQ